MTKNRYKQTKKVFPISLGCRGWVFKSPHSDQDVLMKDATRKVPHENAAFSHIYRYFSTKKVVKKGNFKKQVTLNEKRHFKDAASRFYGQK